VSGVKKYVKCDGIKHIYIPQYESLSIREILVKWSQKENLKLFLPVEKELTSLNKQFIANVAYSVIGDEFQQWVCQLVHERNNDITQKKQLMINMDPDVAAAF